MLRSYLIVAWRNLMRDKGYSLLNVGGLSVGLAVAIFIGLWIRDELSFNKVHEHHETIGAVLQNITTDGTVGRWSSQSYQLGQQLRDNYGDYFRHVIMCYPGSAILTHGDKSLSVTGSFMEEGAPDMLSLKIIKGRSTGLDDPTSLLLSESVAQSLFGDGNPIGQIIKFDNRSALKVVGVYKDVPSHSGFNDVKFIAPLDIEAKRAQDF